jgi:hypothetical protein
MENNIETQKPTFTSKEDKLSQIVQYYVAIQYGKNLPDEHDAKIIDNEFESKFLEIMTDDSAQSLWNIYENSVDVVEYNIDEIENV